LNDCSWPIVACRDWLKTARSGRSRVIDFDPLLPVVKNVIDPSRATEQRLGRQLIYFNNDDSAGGARE
jgi:hypothetical protein